MQILIQYFWIMDCNSDFYFDVYAVDVWTTILVTTQQMLIHYKPFDDLQR